MPQTTARPDGACLELARGLVGQLRQNLEVLIVEPDVEFSPRAIDAFASCLQTVGDLCCVPPGNGTVDYRVKMAPEPIGSDYATARHLLGMVRSLHGPQAIEPSRVCNQPVTVWDLDRCIRPDGHDEHHLTVREDGLALSRASGANLLTEPPPSDRDSAPSVVPKADDTCGGGC